MHTQVLYIYESICRCMFMCVCYILLIDDYVNYKFCESEQSIVILHIHFIA